MHLLIEVFDSLRTVRHVISDTRFSSGVIDDAGTEMVARLREEWTISQMSVTVSSLTTHNRLGYDNSTTDKEIKLFNSEHNLKSILHSVTDTVKRNWSIF